MNKLRKCCRNTSIDLTPSTEVKGDTVLLQLCRQYQILRRLYNLHQAYTLSNKIVKFEISINKSEFLQLELVVTLSTL